MDENTWRFAQLMMWLIGIQTTVIMAAFGGMWLAISKRMEAIEKRMEKMDEKINTIKTEVAVITATLRFNGFDLDRHKAEGE